MGPIFAAVQKNIFRKVVTLRNTQFWGTRLSQSQRGKISLFQGSQGKSWTGMDIRRGSELIDFGSGPLSFERKYLFSHVEITIYNWAPGLRMLLYCSVQIGSWRRHYQYLFYLGVSVGIINNCFNLFEKRHLVYCNGRASSIRFRGSVQWCYSFWQKQQTTLLSVAVPQPSQYG